MPEGDFGELTTVEVCVILEDIQNGLLRTLEFTLYVNLDTAGKIYNYYKGYSIPQQHSCCIYTLYSTVYIVSKIDVLFSCVYSK